MHQTIEPTILYFGTPVALISTLNEDGSPNIASHVIGLVVGMELLGLGAMGKTSENLSRTRQCVVNLPSQEQVTHVDSQTARRRGASGARRSQTAHRSTSDDATALKRLTEPAARRHDCYGKSDDDGEAPLAQLAASPNGTSAVRS
jgi:flavin reductase (DIM6/NTAB) family NADH-FMN oxidoreductase RutF